MYEKSLCVCVCVCACNRVQLWANQLNCRRAQWISVKPQKGRAEKGKRLKRWKRWKKGLKRWAPWCQFEKVSCVSILIISRVPLLEDPEVTNWAGSEDPLRIHTGASRSLGSGGTPRAGAFFAWTVDTRCQDTNYQNTLSLCISSGRISMVFHCISSASLDFTSFSSTILPDSSSFFQILQKVLPSD